MEKSKPVSKRKRTAITANNSSEKESTLSLASLRKSSDTTSEQASKSSSISSRFTGSLNYFSNDYWCPRRNSENPTQSSETGFSIETESASASSGSKENKIPDELNKTIQSENHSPKTSHSARVVNKKYIKYTVMFFTSLGLLYSIDLNNIFFQYKNGKDPDQKGSNNLHKATPLPRPGAIYEPPEFSGELEGSLTYPMSPGELELKKFSDNVEYLKSQLEISAAFTGENNSLMKQVTAFIEIFSKNEKNSIINISNFLYGTAIFTLGGIVTWKYHKKIDYLISKFCDAKDYIIKIFQDFRNDYDQLPEKTDPTFDLRGGKTSGSPIKSVPVLSHKSLTEVASTFDLSDDEPSGSSTGSVSPSLRRVNQSPNGTENFTGHPMHNR